MWNWLRKRGEDDLRKLVSAYRCYLKASDQADFDRLGDDNRQERKWKGGFGKAIHQLFKSWPTPNQSRQFEKNMMRLLIKTNKMDQVFIAAFNEYLKQKKLNEEELSQVIEKGRDAYKLADRIR